MPSSAVPDPGTPTLLTRPAASAGVRSRTLDATRSLLAAADVLILTLAWSLTVIVGSEELVDGAETAGFALVIGAPVVVALFLLQVQGRRWSTFGNGDGIGGRAPTGAAALAALTAAAVAPSVDLRVPLLDAAIGGLLTYIGLLLTYALVRARHRRMAARGTIVRPVVLIGSGPGGRRLARRIAEDRYLGFRLDAVIGSTSPVGDWASGVPWWSELNDVDRVVAIIGDREVFVALEDEVPEVTRLLVERLVDRGVPVSAWSTVTASGSIVSESTFGTDTVFQLATRRRSTWRLACKRAFDVVAAGALLIVASPVIAVAAILIRREDGGPVFFRQRRVGRDGETFELLKLRTMNVGAEGQLVDLTFANERTGPLFKLADDPRRTRIGRFLERLSLDELPQLWNVVRGDMSLVGPRPALPREVETFDPELLRRHLVTPGITGLWQLHARDNPSFDEYRRLDLNYVERWSLSLDLGIFVRTIGSVAKRALRRGRPPEPVIDLTSEAA